MQFTIQDMYSAYRDCIKNKRSTTDYNSYINTYGEGDIFELLDEINSQSYNIGKSKCFVVEKPKIREIFASNFRDRIVHHLVVKEIEPYFEKRFVPTVYSCRKGKGTLYGIKSLFNCVKTVSLSNYYLQMDIKGFFMSIDKDILFSLLDKHIRKKNFEKYKILRYLLKLLIYNEPTEKVKKVGNKQLFEKVPANKSLFKIPKGKGLPIGNLTSQFFANVYLNELDQYVKRELKVKYYFRYVDDFILVGEKDKLISVKEKIEKFLEEKLFLGISENKTRFYPIYYDIDFIGYIIKKKSYIIPRKRNIKAFKNVVLNTKNYSKEVSFRNISSINSYCGMFKYTNSFNIRKKYMSKIQNCIYKNEKNYLKIKNNNYIYDVLDSYKINTMKKYRELEKEYKNYVIIMQIGCFYKSFDFNAVYLSEQLGLKLSIFNPKTKGEAIMCGFHDSLLSKYIEIINKKKINTVIVSQSKDEKGNISRYVDKILTFDQTWTFPVYNAKLIKDIKKEYYDRKIKDNHLVNKNISSKENEFLKEFNSLDIGKENLYSILEFVIKWKKILTNSVDR